MPHTIHRDHPPVYRSHPPSAAARIARRPEWVGCSERTVAQTFMLSGRRFAAGIEELRAMGLEDRVAECLALIEDACGPLPVLSLAEALKQAAVADAAEDGVPEAELRFELETMRRPTKATLEAFLRASAVESYRQEQLRQACRAELAKLEAEDR